MDKDRKRDGAEQTMWREDFMVEAQAARIRQLCGEGSRFHFGGSRPAPERAPVMSLSEKSAEAS